MKVQIHFNEPAGSTQRSLSRGILSSMKMFEMTSLAGKKILVNFQLVRWIESVPDTILCFLDGTRLPVKESFSEIQESLNNKESESQWKSPQL